MRKLIYYIATSLDGYIAHEDGSFDGFPFDEEFIGALLREFPETIPAHFRGPATREQNKWFDAVLMGRKTYEVGLKDGVTNPYPTLDQYVFSRSMSERPDENVTLIKESPEEFVSQLKHEAGKAIWLCGGGELAGELMRAGLIDQLIIKLNPVLFNSGIPLFSGAIAQTALTLTDTRVFGGGQAILFYDV